MSTKFRHHPGFVTPTDLEVGTRPKRGDPTDETPTRVTAAGCNGCQWYVCHMATAARASRFAPLASRRNLPRHELFQIEQELANIHIHKFMFGVAANEVSQLAIA